MLKANPKVNKLNNVSNLELHGRVDLANPSIVCHGIMHSRPLALGWRNDKRNNVLRSISLQPRSIPKRCFPSIGGGDGGGRMEDIVIYLVARVSHPNPQFGQILPLQPWPRSLRALANFSRWRIPNPPRCVGGRRSKT